MSPKQEVVHVAVASAHLASNIVHRLHIHAPTAKEARAEESAPSAALQSKQYLYLPSFNGL